MLPSSKTCVPTLFFSTLFVISSYANQFNNGAFDFTLGSKSQMSYTTFYLEEGSWSVVDLSKLTFSSIGVNNDVNNYEEARVEVAVFEISKDNITATTMKDSNPDCNNWLEHGIGLSTDEDGEGTTELCCTNDAVDLGLCKFKDAGKIALDESHYDGYYEHFTLPAEDDFQRHKDVSLQLGGPATFVVLFGSCSYGEREVHIRGDILVNAEPITSAQATCGKEEEEQEEDDDENTPQVANPVDISFDTHSSGAQYAKVQIDSPMQFDLTKLTFSPTSSDNVAGEVEIAVFRWFDDSTTSDSEETAEECHWMGSGVGTFTEDGEGEICCTDAAANKGLCDSADIGRINVDFSLFEGYYEVLPLPEEDDFATNIANGKFELEDSGTYVVLFAKCHGATRPFRVTGDLMMESDTMTAFSTTSPDKCCTASSCDDLSSEFEDTKNGSPHTNDHGGNGAKTSYSVEFGGSSGAVWYSEVHADENTVIDLSDLTFSSAGNAYYNKHALHVEVAVFPWFRDSDDMDFRPECNWMDSGIGNIAKHGELNLCCTTDAFDKGLCGSQQPGKLIRDNAAFVGHYDKLNLVSKDGFEGRIVKNSIYKPGVAGTYIVVLANCNDFGREIHASGSVSVDMELFFEASTDNCCSGSSCDNNTDDDDDDDDYLSTDDDGGDDGVGGLGGGGGGFTDPEIGLYSDLDLQFTLQPNSGVIKYIELYTMSSGAEVNMEGVQFWSDASEPKSQVVGNRADESTSTQIDVILVNLDESFIETPSACNLVDDLGIGAATPGGEIRWCCTDDAVDLGLCSNSELGETIIDHSILGDATQLKVDVPSGGEASAAELAGLDSKISTGKAGRYLMIFSDCNAGDEDVHTKGKVTWDDDDSMNSFLPIQELGETCCEGSEESECGGDVLNTLGDIEIAIQPDSTVVSYAEISPDPEGGDQLGKLSFWISEVPESHDTKVDVAFFLMPNATAARSSSRSACNWVNFGVGAVAPDGEIHMCCDDLATDLGLCPKSSLGGLIFNNSIYRGEKQLLEISDDKHINKGEIEPKEPGSYIVILSNCKKGGEEIEVSARMTETRDMLSYLNFTCRNKQFSGSYVPLVILMIGITFVALSFLRSKVDEIRIKQKKDVFTNINESFLGTDLI